MSMRSSSGFSGIAAPRRPRAELERREIRRPDDVRELGDAQLVGVAAARERDARRLDPVRPLLRNALLPDHLAADAFRLPLQLAGPLAQRVDDPVADRDEVLDEVELRLAARRKVDLVGVRHLDDAAADVELHEWRRHGGRDTMARLAEGWQSGRMRRSRKPLSVVRRIEGSNPSPSAHFPRDASPFASAEYFAANARQLDPVAHEPGESCAFVRNRQPAHSSPWERTAAARLRRRLEHVGGRPRRRSEIRSLALA